MPVTLIKRLKNCENHNLGIELQKTEVTLTFKLLLTLSQTTNFRPFKTEGVSRRQFLT